jgi:hypothetical protein
MLFLSLVFAPASHAALQAVGPVDPATGLPAWYQDTTGLSLAPCFDNNGFCTTTIAAVPNPTIPFLPRPNANFPDEGFYYVAGADVPTAGGTILYEAAIEFAFGGAGAVVAGNEITFARTRFVNRDAPAGTYTITHPYGPHTVEVTADDVARGRGLFFTEDNGDLGVQFQGVLTAPNTGPFLRRPGGLVTSPDGNVYIGDSITFGPVIGTAVTSVTVAGPLSGTTNLFALEGKVIGMSITPTSIAFPAQRADVISAPVLVTVANLDTLNALTVASIVVEGTNLADFLIADVNCLTGPVAAGGNCTFNVTFRGAASATAARTAQIVITAGTTLPKAFVTPVTGIIDSVPPTSTAHFPDVATIPANVAITVAFTEAMLESSITDTTFTVLANGVPVVGTRTFATANNEATFIPTVGDLPENAAIAVEATTGMTDLVGNPLSTAVTFTFTTTAADRTPPTISSITPANNVTGVRTDAAITITFSEPMLGSTITATTIQVTSAGVAVDGTLTLAGNVATFTPASALAFGTSYTITVGTGAQDQLRNALSTGQTVNFVTNFQPAPPVVVSPGNGATAVARPVILRWQRSSDSDPGDVIAYHLFLCNNPSFIGTAPNCIQNVPITPVAAQAKGIYYASVASGSMLFTLFGLGWAFGFKGRKKILLMIAVLAISGLFIVSCSSKSDDGGPAPSTDVTFQVDGLSPNVTYFWKMEADDGKGGVAATPVMTFTTQ